MTDLVLSLREARRRAGLSQKDLARASGVGEKTISSFETGNRIDSAKVSQIVRIADACAVPLVSLFSAVNDPFETIEQRPLRHSFDALVACARRQHMSDADIVAALASALQRRPR